MSSLSYEWERFISQNVGANKLSDDEILRLVADCDLYIPPAILNHLFGAYPSITSQLFTIFTTTNEYRSGAETLAIVGQYLSVNHLIVHIDEVNAYKRAAILWNSLVRQTLTPASQEDRDELKDCYLRYNHEWQLLFKVLDNCGGRPQHYDGWFLRNIPLYPSERHIDICADFRQRSYVDTHVNALPEDLKQYVTSR